MCEASLCCPGYPEILGSSEPLLLLPKLPANGRTNAPLPVIGLRCPLAVVGLRCPLACGTFEMPPCLWCFREDAEVSVDAKPCLGFAAR